MVVVVMVAVTANMKDEDEEEEEEEMETKGVAAEEREGEDGGRVNDCRERGKRWKEE